MRQLTLEEARGFLKIDKNNLDAVCEDQAMLFSDIADAYAKAKGQKDSLKDDRETLYAQLYFKVAEEAEANKTRITEDYKKNAVRVDESYIALSKKLIEYSQVEEEWRVVKDAMMHRVSMVKELCQLYISQYYIKSYIADAKK